MGNKYCNLYSVDIGTQLIAGRTKNYDAYPGDLVFLESGESGRVAKRIFIEDGGEDYDFFADFLPIVEIVEVFRHAWSKEDGQDAS